MRRTLLIISMGLSLTVPVVPVSRSILPQVEASPVRELRGGAGSQRGLIAELLHALEARDADGLRRLRVTESEFRDIVMPGHVPPGRPLRQWSDDWKAYAWSDLSTKSHYYELQMLKEFGGRELTVKEMSFAEGETQYAGYKAYRQLRLTVTDPNGEEHHLATGSIAEIGGQFKFISYIRD